MNKGVIVATALLSLVSGLAYEGDHCQGYNESTEAPFPECNDGFECREIGPHEISIPGRHKRCVRLAQEG